MQAGPLVAAEHAWQTKRLTEISRRNRRATTILGGATSPRCLRRQDQRSAQKNLIAARVNRADSQAVMLLRRGAVLVLLALWVPANSHALLQQVGLIHQHIEQHDHREDGEAHDHGPVDAKDHDAADGICRVELQSTKAPCPALGVLFAVPECDPDFVHTFVRECELSGPSPPGTTPPPPSGPRAPPLI